MAQKTTPRSTGNGAGSAPASGRHRVADTTIPPWRSIAHLDITYQNGNTATGTAWFFGDRSLATAGHNIRHWQNGEAATILVSPAFNGTVRPFGPFAVPASGRWCDPNFDGTPNSTLDYAALILTDPTPGQQLGAFELAVYSDAKLNPLQISIGGYAILPGPRTQYGNEGRLEAIEKDFLRYRLQTVRGMSGAPIFARVGAGYVAVGIHTGSENQLDWGRRIDNDLRQALMGFSGA